MLAGRRSCCTVGFPGPVVAFPPTGAEALTLWDAILALAVVPGELKASRPRVRRLEIPGSRLSSPRGGSNSDVLAAPSDDRCSKAFLNRCATSPCRRERRRLRRKPAGEQDAARHGKGPAFRPHPIRDASKPAGTERRTTSVSAAQGWYWWAWEDLNLRPLPYQLTAGNRCAEGRFCRSLVTVDAKVKWSIGVQLSVLQCVLNPTDATRIIASCSAPRQSCPCFTSTPR